MFQALKQVSLFFLLPQVVAWISCNNLYSNGVLGIKMGFSFFLLPQVVAGVLDQEKKWVIRSVEGIRAAAALLPHKQPTDELRVELYGSTPTELQPLLGAVTAAGYEGKLWLYLEHSYLYRIPCDEQVQQLKGAKWVKIWGYDIDEFELNLEAMCIEKKNTCNYLINNWFMIIRYNYINRFEI